MHKPNKVPNIVPRGAIRVSEAFEQLCRQVEPAWEDLQQRCVEWDEHSDYGVDERGEDPYPRLVAATYHAEMIFRTALRDGHLRAYIHNMPEQYPAHATPPPHPCPWNSGHVRTVVFSR
jgi:hypothetical protein